MRTINVFEQDEVVMVIDIGQRYSTFQSAYKFANYPYTDIDELGYKLLKEEHLYTVVSTLVKGATIMTFIKDKSGYIYLIDNSGLVLHIPQAEKWA